MAAPKNYHNPVIFAPKRRSVCARVTAFLMMALCCFILISMVVTVGVFMNSSEKSLYDFYNSVQKASEDFIKGKGAAGEPAGKPKTTGKADSNKEGEGVNPQVLDATAPFVDLQPSAPPMDDMFQPSAPPMDDDMFKPSAPPMDDMFTPSAPYLSNNDGQYAIVQHDPTFVYKPAPIPEERLTVIQAVRQKLPLILKVALALTILTGAAAAAYIYYAASSDDLEMMSEEFSSVRSTVYRFFAEIISGAKNVFSDIVNFDYASLWARIVEYVVDVYTEFETIRTAFTFS